MKTVHIVATSARTPVGLYAEAAAAAIRAGLGRLAEHPFWVDSGGEPLVVASDALLDARASLPERLVQMAESAIEELASKTPMEKMRADPIPLFLSCPELSKSKSPSSEVALSIEKRAKAAPGGGRIALREVHHGHAGGLLGLSQACEALRRGAAELCWVGGVHSYMHADALDPLFSAKRILGAGVRSGFHPGEGAGFLALASEAGRARLGLPSLGTVEAVAIARQEDGGSIRREGAVLGEALTEAVRRVTSHLALPKEKVTDVLCDINGERPRVDEWAFTALKTQSVLEDATEYRAPASEWGDQGAATVPLLVMLATHAWMRGYARGNCALVWAASDDGTRAAAVLKAPSQRSG
jgi:3-oxoacyl-[acyl-carrier-protein] synthase-1